MRFFVIYSLDVPDGESIRPYQPPNVRRWDRTEGDESYEYGYLEGCWERGKHRKYVALLERTAFDAFVDHVGLRAEDCETGGSLMGFGHLPAISFDARDADVILNAYVTPVPQDRHGEEREGLGERAWERVRSAVIGHYGLGS